MLAGRETGTDFIEYINWHLMPNCPQFSFYRLSWDGRQTNVIAFHKTNWLVAFKSPDRIMMFKTAQGE